MYHVPVLLKESVDLLNIDPDGVYVDVTFGGGGHSREILGRLSKKGHIIGFDQDSDALKNRIDDNRFILINSNFKFLRGALRAAGFEEVDGILADLGVSSHHFDAAERGFSYRFDADLDMRMNQSAKISAKTVVNNYSFERLATIFREYGELKNAGKVANAINVARHNGSIESIGQLLEVVDQFAPRGSEMKFRSQLFQALRIEVNGEIQALEMMLEQSLKILRPGGRLVVISYHSLEDRLAKNFIKSGNFTGEVEKDFYGNITSPFKVITRKPITASEEEMKMNTRSRSAMLRCGEKLTVQNG